MGLVTVIGSYIVAQVIDADRIPAAGETLTGRNYHVTHGGKGSNMACCAARLGTRTRFLGKVGRDSFGAAFVDLLRREQVSTEGVLYSVSLPTAMGFIVCGRDGSNIIVIDPGANAEFSPADIAVASGLIESSDVVMSPLEIPLETALAGARLAARYGIRAILNPAPASDLRASDLSCVFALTPNEGEALVCLGREDAHTAPDECARALLDLGACNAILTLGGRGALWASHGGLWRIPALQVDVLDTVGAGDAFNAGLAAGLSEGQALDRAIAMGVTAASLSTRKRETIESYAYREEVDSRVAEVLARIERC
jgi:ribokinase